MRSGPLGGVSVRAGISSNTKRRHQVTAHLLTLDICLNLSLMTSVTSIAALVSSSTYLPFRPTHFFYLSTSLLPPFLLAPSSLLPPFFHLSPSLLHLLLPPVTILLSLSPSLPLSPPTLLSAFPSPCSLSSPFHVLISPIECVPSRTHLSAGTYVRCIDNSTYNSIGRVRTSISDDILCSFIVN